MSSQRATGGSTAASPCTDVCTMDASTGWCLGCRRTIDEIAAWGTLDDASRRRVLALLPARRLPDDPPQTAGEETAR